MSAALPVAPFEWSEDGDFAAPFEYVVPASGEVQPYTATATYDGSGAGGAFIPTISLYSAAGNLLARVNPSAVLQPGDVAEVTFVPPFGAAASDQPGTGGIRFNTDNEGGYLFVRTNDSHDEGLGTYGIQMVDNSGEGVLIDSGAGQGQFQSNGGMLIAQRDKDGDLEITDNSDGGLVLTELGQGGIIMRSHRDINVTADNSMFVQASAAVEIDGTDHVICRGQFVSLTSISSTPGVTGVAVEIEPGVTFEVVNLLSPTTIYLQIGSGGTFMPTLPTSNPGVAGQLYRNGAGSPAAVMVV